MPHYELEYQAFDGVNLYFQGWLTDKDPKGIICLVHGLGEHSGRYTYWASLLNRADYSVLTYDLRGHGRSGGQRGHVSSYSEYLNDTDLLLKEARQRFPESPCFLYGHSLGGIIVAYYVLQRKPKVNGVIITALPHKSSLQEQKGKIAVVKILGSIAPKMPISTGLVPTTISKDPEVVSQYINDPLVHHQSSVGWGTSTLESIAWTLQHANEWTLPVLFMHGELDKLGYAEGSREFAGKIKGDCTLKIWPNLFHEVHNEPEKEQVFMFLRQWLDKHIST
jgi:alpha-beta hydrolase superfamily lysophospholipase